ncbi:MAG: ABC transporter ATP-binding protein [Flavobacteriales bacterium]|jgi:ABC-type lipoprotein export system ATPase subunit|tara:strand:- start:1531 stop:2196 length:666 start_codon:yes stop_codon:yes gene_type:complete
MIAACDLKFSYSETTSLEFPDFKCQNGNKLLLIGNSGSGKTTLLHLLCGLIRPDSGSMQVAGLDLNTLGDRELDKFRGRELGIVFQQSHFVQSLTVAENLALPTMLTGSNITAEELKVRTHELLDRLGIGHKFNSYPKDLSVGEQQRASIARALVHKPSVVFADEPTSALDDKSTESVIRLLEEETEKVGASLIIVTHDSRLKNRYKDRVELQPIQPLMNA